MKKNLLALVALVLVFTSGSLYAQKSADLEKNKDFIKVYTEDFWNKHNIAAFEKYFSSDFIIHNANGDMNAEQYKGLCQAYFAAFPDMHVTTDYLVAEGDRVVKVWTVNSTHQGELMGIPASGKTIVIKGIEMFRIADGKIAELWVSMDDLGMMQQLGVIPPMGE
jgi:steroid delta-isomerase-like uncharacterized protein